MNNKPEELKQYLTIDKNSLDDELLHQAAFLHAIADTYEEAMSYRDTLKEHVTVIDAELDTLFRDEAEKRGEKPTEAVIKARILTDRKHKAAFLVYSQAKAKTGKLGALKDAFKERGYMLRELCALYLAGYYEQNAVRASTQTDNAVYKRQRQRLAEGRERKATGTE